MSASSLAIRIDRIPDGEQDAALRLVFAGTAEAERDEQIAMLRAAAPDEANAFEGLLGAYSGEKLVAAMLFQIQSGNTANIWSPQIVPEELGSRERLPGQLLAVATDRLATRGIRMVQCLLQTDSQPEADILRKGGFCYASDLLYLVCLQTEFPAVASSSPLEFEGYSPIHHDRLARLVNATYSETLDCPALNGVREIEDVLAGYRATGVFDPHRWLIVRHRGADVGCLILTEHPNHDTWELVYMGLIPQARGHGFGMDIARHGQWLTRQAGRSRLVLAVDAANEPAIRMYAAVGFQAWDRRSVFLKVLGHRS